MLWESLLAGLTVIGFLLPAVDMVEATELGPVKTNVVSRSPRKGRVRRGYYDLWGNYIPYGYYNASGSSYYGLGYYPSAGATYYQNPGFGMYGNPGYVSPYWGMDVVYFPY